jgi:hypothetical protein
LPSGFVYWSAASVIAFLTAGEAMVQYVMIKLSTGGI